MFLSDIEKQNKSNKNNWSRILLSSFEKVVYQHFLVKSSSERTEFLEIQNNMTFGKKVC